MPRRSMRLVMPFVGTALAGCSSPQPKPLAEPVTVRVTAVDSAQPVRFTLEVTGGEAEFRAPELQGRAAEPRLTASTPAEIVLRPGTTAASFRAVSGGRLAVVAVTPRAQLVADGARVRLASSETGLSIRDY